MKKKDYLKPTVQVVKLQQQTHLMAGSVTGGVSATMDGTFTETDLAREATFSDDVLFLEDE